MTVTWHGSHMTPIVTVTLLWPSEDALGCQGRQWHNAIIKRQWKFLIYLVITKLRLSIALYTKNERHSCHIHPQILSALECKSSTDAGPTMGQWKLWRLTPKTHATKSSPLPRRSPLKKKVFGVSPSTVLPTVFSNTPDKDPHWEQRNYPSCNWTMKQWKMPISPQNTPPIKI